MTSGVLLKIILSSDNQRRLDRRALIVEGRTFHHLASQADQTAAVLWASSPDLTPATMLNGDLD